MLITERAMGFLLSPPPHAHAALSFSKAREEVAVEVEVSGSRGDIEDTGVKAMDGGAYDGRGNADGSGSISTKRFHVAFT
jgi:hypothetical protein